MKVRIVQGKPLIGKVSFNLEKIISEIKIASNEACDVIIFPELFLTGYPLEDRIFSEDLENDVKKSIKKVLKISASFKDLHILLPTPTFEKNKIYNSVLVILNGKAVEEIRKSCLPNYGVFDEARYFTSGKVSQILTIKGKKVLISICEEIWNETYIEYAKKLKPEILLSINASPFEKGKFERRLARVEALKCDAIYVNSVLGYDEIIFDGRSFAISKTGKMLLEMPSFKELSVNFEFKQEKFKQEKLPKKQEDLALLYEALVFGLSQYVSQNNFKGIILGLSGGIDSALCAKIALDAVGAKNVLPVLLPSKISGPESKKDALDFLKLNGLKHKEISIVKPFEEIRLATGSLSDVSLQNLQSRIRGSILMALSNETGKMLITTGNKSELSIGYCTIYGDMNGGFNPIKDIFKTEVFKLCNFLNKSADIFPENILTKAPTAELAENQTDEASFGLPYTALDFTLKLIIEEKLSRQKIEKLIQKNFLRDVNIFRKSIKISELTASEIFEKVQMLLSKSQFKRAQSACGTKVSSASFGRDWRFGLQY